MVDEDGAKVVDIGEGRAGDRRVVQCREKAIAAIIGRTVLGADAGTRSARPRVGTDNGAGDLLCTVDTIGVGHERMDAGQAVELDRNRQQEFDIAAAPAMFIMSNKCSLRRASSPTPTSPMCCWPTASRSA